MGKDGVVNLELSGLNCSLFKGLNTEEIQHLVEISSLEIQKFSKDSYIFEIFSMPKFMYVLMEGSITLEKYDVNGKRIIVNSFSEMGTVFGEVYLYLQERPFDYSCRAVVDTTVLAIPKNFILELQNEKYGYFRKIVTNMLQILSEKAFFLNQKLLILSSYSLRQKIANFLIQNAKPSGEVILHFNREEFAEYIGTTRPSLSRELSSMEEDGLIQLSRGKVQILDRNALSLLR
ncbi:MAG: Crp/Fnr family transcriptional regulator [Tissierellia bacterium]|nr:Crp/Fnr family transcriptional regulator [Tissierellia bacterium]